MSDMDKKGFDMSYEDILSHLKNRPPLLMIQSAYVIPGERAMSQVVLTGEEWYFKCHFPGMPLVPGVLQLETLFNTAALAIKTIDGMKTKTSNISKVDNVAFRVSICPGDVMQVDTKVVKAYKRGVAWFHGQIKTGKGIVCEADFSLSVPEDMVIKRRF